MKRESFYVVHLMVQSNQSDTKKLNTLIIYVKLLTQMI